VLWRINLFLVGVFALPVMAVADMIDSDGIAPYEVCALCHSLDGNSPMAKFPKLAGQPNAYIEKQILDFLTGERDNDGGQMVSIVAELSPEDIPVVAQWFASQSAPAPADIGDAANGAELFSQLGCDVCHSERETTGLVPHLTAQHAGYLTKQMMDYRDGRRGNDANGAMQGAMRDVTDTQIEAVAAYLAATKRGFDEDS